MLHFDCFNVILTFSLLSLSYSTGPCDNIEISERQLLDEMFDSKDNWQRPARSVRAIEVSLTLNLAGIQDIFERDRTMILHGFFSLAWQDDFHIWNDSFPKNCTAGVAVPSKNIWLPDVCLVNAANRYEIISQADERAYVYSNGTVNFWPGGDFKLYCDLNLRLFPLDTHTCKLHLESWVNKIHQQVFSKQSSFQIKHFITNSQWEFLEGYASVPESISKNLSKESHDRFFIYITVKRKFLYYGINIVIPSVIIALANFVTFMLPPEHAKRLAISITCLLAFSIFQRIVASDMPRSSDHPPMLLVYFVLQMAYICMSMIGSALVIFVRDKAKPYCSHQESFEMSPRLFRFVKVIGSCCCYRRCHQSTECKLKYTAGLLERSVALTYLVLSVTTAVTMLLIYPAVAGALS